MSNATIIQTNTDIFIGSDSASSAEINGVLYRLDTDAIKLYLIDDRVIFCSGELIFSYDLMNKYMNQNDRSNNMLRDLIQSDYSGQEIEVAICEFAEGQTIIHHLHPCNNFKPISYKDIPKGGVNILTLGIKTKESFEIANRHVMNGSSINNIYKSVFDGIAFEGVGGQLDVFRINRKGVSRFLSYAMREKQNMNMINNDVLKSIIERHLIVGEQVYGKLISGVNLALEDEDGVLKFQGSKGEIFDRNGDLVMKLGLVDENPDIFGLWSFNDITRVRVDDHVGFSIDRRNYDLQTYPDGWEKILWADQSDGTLYAHDLVAENLKIVNNVGKTIVDAERNYLDLGDFEDIVLDNKLISIEKMQLITELYKIESSYKRILEQAEEYKKSQRDDSFDTSTQFFEKTESTRDLYSTQPITDAFNDLLTYMSSYIKINSFDPLVIDVNDALTESTSEIDDRAEFILKYKNYYDEETNLRNKIEDSMFYSSLNMGQYYNNMVMGEYGLIALRSDGKYRAWLNATNGLALQRWEDDRWVNKVYASIGNSTYPDGTLIAEDLIARRLRIETRDGGVLLDVNSLNFDFSVLNSIILDDVIMSPEKITLSNQLKSITQQYNELQVTLTRYASTVYNDRDSSYYGLDNAKNQLVSARTELVNAYNALSDYLVPVFADMNAKTHIVDDLNSTRLEFYQKWEDFYKAYENGRNKLADFLEKSTLQLGRNYNNTVIDAQNGIVVTRGNMMNRTIMNATEGISIEANIGTAQVPVWVKKFYAGLDGKLYAEDLEAIRLRILSDEGDMLIDGNERKMYLNKFDLIGAGLITSELIITNTITADNGYIANLTVNHLKTLSKDGEIGDYVDYIDIYENKARWITGRITGKEQAVDSRGDQLYWRDTERKYLTTDVTPHVAYSYELDDMDKLTIGFMESGLESYPYSVWGYGDGNIVNTPDFKDSSRGYIVKNSTDFYLRYNASSTANRREVKLSDQGIEIQSEDASIEMSGMNIEITSQNGKIDIKHGSGTGFGLDETGETIYLKHHCGSVFEVRGDGLNAKIAGDININATGAIKIIGSSIELN